MTDWESRALSTIWPSIIFVERAGGTPESPADLRHIWGDDGGGCNGPDFVDDTPNQADHNFGTPTFPHVSWSSGPDGDLFMNYMDYVDDVAMFMFSNGQVQRMQACMDTNRRTINIP